MAEKVKEFRGLIYGKYDSEAEFARKIGWTRQKVNQITNGKREPDVNDLNIIAHALDKSIGEIAEIFLRYKSPNKQQNSIHKPAS